VADPGKTVVLIGGRAHREFEVLHDLGYRILYLDKRVPLHLMAWVDVPVDVDTDDWDQVAEVVRDQLDGQAPAAVLTHVEPRIPLMAHLAEQLLPVGRGLTTSAARNCRDKWHTRTVLEAAGLPVPRFGLAEATREAARIARDIGFPVVVKPRDGAGAGARPSRRRGSPRATSSTRPRPTRCRACSSRSTWTVRSTRCRPSPAAARPACSACSAST